MAKKPMSWASTKVYDWKNYVTPARPSKTELKITEEYIKKLKRIKKKVKVAILGCTVEFRSLCHKHNVDVTLIEFAKKHCDVLSKQPMKYKGKEKLREENWKQMSTKQKYDLILGDLVLNVDSVNVIRKVLGNLNKSLVKDGYCILRTWVRKNNKRYDVEKVLKEHRKKWFKPHFYTYCIMPLYMCFYDFKNDSVSYPVMIEGLKKQMKKGNVSKKDYLYCYNRWRHEGVGFTIPTKTKMEKLKKEFFKIEKIKYGRDCFSKWGPIYVLRKK